MRDYTEDFRELRVPSVHLNGTSRGELREQLFTAMRAATQLMDALQAACPHDRDYYVKGPGEGVIAREQHRDRIARVESVYREITFILQDMQDTEDFNKTVMKG